MKTILFIETCLWKVYVNRKKCVLHRDSEPRTKNISAFQTSPRVDDV